VTGCNANGAPCPLVPHWWTAPPPPPTTHLPLPLRLQLKGVQTELTEVRDAATSTAAKLTATVETMTIK
jgi:hypothetical protein